MELNDILSEPEEVVEPVEQPELPATPDGEARHGERKTLARQKEREAQEAGRAPAKEPVAKEEPKPVEVKPVVPPPEQELTAKERAAFAKAADEARKRQGLETEVARLTALVNAKPKEPAKPFWDAPDEALSGTMKTVEDRNAAALAEMQNVAINTRLQTAEMIARDRHDDYDTMVAVFGESVQQSPVLWQEALKSANPAEYAYQKGKAIKELRDAGNIDTLIANKEKELRLKWDAEQKEKQEASRKERSSIPPSLSNARGGSTNKVVWSGPPPLDDVLAD